MFPLQTSPGSAILHLEVKDHTSPSVMGQEQNGTPHSPGALPSGPALPAALLGNLFAPWGVAKRAFLRNYDKEAFGGAPSPTIRPTEAAGLWEGGNCSLNKDGFEK